MGKMKDYLLELEETSLRKQNESLSPSISAQLAKSDSDRKTLADNFRASKNSFPAKKGLTNCQLSQEDISSTRFRKGSPGID